MSKPVKGMIIEQYRQRFEGVEGAVIVDLRGLDATENNQFRNELRAKNVRVTVVKNSLARKAIAGTPLEAVSSSLVGPAAFAYGGSSVVDVARQLIEWSKKVKPLELKAAVLDGQLFAGEEGVRRLSQFPTREEAQAKVVALLLAPAGNVVGAATGPARKLMGIVKEIQDRLEKGETIAKAG